MRIIAIGAHPDDIEIFMLGLMARFRNEGNEIHFLVATDGSLGGLESKARLKKIRAEETRSALKNYGKLHLLGLPDGSLGDKESHKNILKKRINDLKPDLVVTHYKKDYHSDHRALSVLITNIIGHYVPIIFCDTLMGINFIPNYYVDISEFFQMKKDAIMKHESQNPNRFVELAKLMNGYRAAQCNAPKGFFAEAYLFDRSFPFADISNILPSSLDLRPFHIKNVNGFL